MKKIYLLIFLCSCSHYKEDKLKIKVDSILNVQKQKKDSIWHLKHPNYWGNTEENNKHGMIKSGNNLIYY